MTYWGGPIFHQLSAHWARCRVYLIVRAQNALSSGSLSSQRVETSPGHFSTRTNDVAMGWSLSEKEFFFAFARAPSSSINIRASTEGVSSEASSPSPLSDRRIWIFNSPLKWGGWSRLVCSRKIRVQLILHMTRRTQLTNFDAALLLCYAATLGSAEHS